MVITQCTTEQLLHDKRMLDFPERAAGLRAGPLGRLREGDTVKTLEEVVEQLKRDPAHAVRTKVGDLTIEVRAVPEPTVERSAAELFGELGPWGGETTEEILALLAEGRRVDGRRSVSGL